MEKTFFLLHTLNVTQCVYKKDTDIAEKGDNKTIIGLRKIIGQFTLPGWENATIRGAWENLERPI